MGLREIYWYSADEDPKVLKKNSLFVDYIIEIGDINIFLNSKQAKRLYEELNKYFGKK